MALGLTLKGFLPSVHIFLTFLKWHKGTFFKKPIMLTLCFSKFLLFFFFFSEVI